MSDYTTNASVNLNVNGKEAEETLAKLKQRANDYKDAIAKASKEGNQTELKKLRKELRSTEREIKSIQDATMNVADVLKNLDKATPKELKRTLKTLETQLNNLERGSEAWKKQTEHIKRVREEIDKVNKELRNGEGFWDRFNRKMNDWQTTLAAGAAAVTGIVLAGRSAVNAYAEMDAEMANVRKFTGMTAEQVELLNQEFKNIDTRTTREDLNKLAQEAGRLGKSSQEDVLGFVKAADQINVALDDLGDGATLTLSKLTGIFGDEERLGTEKSLLAVGSVINELSQNCSASAPYLAEFASRLGGVGSQAGMTIPQIMGYAAVLDSNNQKVEASATALSQVLTRLYQDPAKYAKPAGLEVEKFTKLLKEDANGALILLLESLNKMGGMDVLSPIFAEMGENGSRAISALSTLAGNIEQVKSQQEVANVAFEEATSIGKEFEVQNTTVQASLDKSRNRLNELKVELGEKLAPVMRHVISSTTILLNLMSPIINFIVKYKGELIVLTASIVAYNVAVNFATIKTKLYAVAQGVAKVATVAWTVVTYLSAAAIALFSGNVTRATIAFKAFSATLKLSPIGLVFGAITALIGGIVLLTRRTSEAVAVENMMNKIREDAREKVSEERTQIELLVAAAKNEKLSLDDRKKAIDKLNQIIPNYNAQLDDTTGKYRDNKKALDDYLVSLTKKYEIEGAKDQLAEIGKETARLKTERAETEAQLAEVRKRNAKSSSKGGTPTPQTSGGAVAPGSYHESIANSAEVNALEDKLSSIDAKIKTQETKKNTITGIYGEDLQKDAANSPVADPPEDTKCPKCKKDPCVCNTGGDKNKDRFEAEKEWKEREEALNRIAYATGEKTYEEYTNRMNEISVQYYDKLRHNKEATALEQLQFEAQYYDALSKQSDENQKQTLDKETNSYNERLAEAKQFFIDGKYSIETYNEAVARIEEEHMRNMVSLTKEGTKERKDAEKALADFQYNEVLKKQQETKKKEAEIKKTQANLKNEYFGDNAVERKNAYERDLANLQIVYDAELKATQGNAEEKLRIEEAYEKAKLALKLKYGLENRNMLEKANAELAEWLESDAGKAVTQSFDTIMSGMGAIFSQVSSLVQAELDIETAAIEDRYDKEISQAEGNSYKIAKLEKQKEEEIAKAKNEANKKMFAMQVIQAVAQTAQNALNAYGSAAAIPVVGFVMAPIAAAMAVAAGALQIAAIKKQQQASEAQGYSKGGFTPPGAVDEAVGVVHAGEWVASQKLLANPVARPLINALDYAQRSNTIGALKADDVSRSISAPTRIASSNESNGMIVALNSQTLALTNYADSMHKLNDRLDEPFVTVNTVSGDNGIKKAQDEYDKLMRNKTPKSKRK